MALRRIFRCLGIAALALVASCTATEPKPAATQYLVTAGTDATAGVIVTLKAQLADAAGHPVAIAGTTVTWTKTGAGGVLSTPPTSTTDASGIATMLFQTGTVAGVSYVITATDNAGLTGQTTITTVAGQASKYVVSVSTLSPLPGASVTISAQLSDASGNTVRTAGKLVGWARIGTGGALTATSSTTDANGLATVDFTASTTAGTRHSVAVIDNTGLTGTSPEFITVAGAASKYLVTVSTAAPAAGGTVTVTAQLADANGNGVATVGKTVTWAKTGTGGSLSAATSQTNANGIATVVLTVGTAAGASHAVTATDNTALSGTSPVITVVPGPAAKYLVSASANAPVAGSAVTIAAQLADAFDNPVVTSGRVVTWTKSGTGGSFASATSTTAANGVASVVFTTGTIAGVAYTVTATDNGSLTGTSSAFTTVAGPAARYVVTASASAPTAGNPVAITAQVADANGNAVTLSGKVVTWTKTGNGGSFSSATSVTNASGVASVTFTTSTTVGTVHTVTATDNTGLTGTSGDITTASLLASVRFGSTVLVVDSSGTITPAVSARDAGGTVVAGAGITLTSRNTNVATVSGANVSGVRTGQTFLIATSVDNPNAKDSAVVLIANVAAPVVTVAVPRFDLKTDTTFTVSIVVDMRASSEALGAATLQVTWNPNLLSYVGNGGGTTGVNAVVNTSGATSGSVIMAMASSAGFSGAVEIRTLTFKASATAGRTGALAVVVTDLSGAGTFTNLLPKVVSGTYPLITR